MRGGKAEYLREVRIVHLEDPFSGLDGDLTYLDRIAAAGQEATDLQGLDWLGKEDLISTLAEGRKAAGVSERRIARAHSEGTIAMEATIIRLAAQGHTNEGIATLLDTTEGTVRNRWQRIRRWLTAMAEQSGVACRVEEWERSGGNHARAVQIQHTYPHGRKGEMSLVSRPT